MKEQKIINKPGLGFYVSLFGTVLILLWVGAFKFTITEANGIKDLVINHPLTFWMYDVFSIQMVSNLIVQTFMHIFDEKFPGQFSTQDCLKFIGPSLKQTFDELTPGETEEMIKKYKEWNTAHHDELVKGYDAVVETLEQLRNEGIKLAIVSTKSREGLAHGIKVLGAEHLFEVIISMDEVTHVKPHPEPVLLALEKLGVSKEEAIMIGDNSHCYSPFTISSKSLIWCSI